MAGSKVAGIGGGGGGLGNSGAALGATGATGAGATAAGSPACATARNAAQTIGRFDLIIADHHLPDGNGAALLAELKEQCGCATVIVSGHEPPAGPLPAGVDHWIPKPVDLTALTQMVRSMV